ncbi:MAG TPA: flagellar hook-associated protein FlgK [Gemmatimonadaceae bacterium]|jgi:flagellar hook-associated protein 1 FlgK
MSIGSILNSARSGMAAQQLAVQIASQNIANADTTGYSRQRVELATSISTAFPYGTIGTGVTVTDISRARDSMLDAQYRQDSSGQTNAETTSTALGQIQQVYDEPSDSGLSATLDQFWGAWNDLSNDPTSGAAKGAVRAAGQSVASTLNRFASQLDQVDQMNRETANGDVSQINQLAKQVVDYNTKIISQESSGHTAGDLRDARDNLLDQLSTLTGGQTVERSNGNVAFFVGGRMLVDGAVAKQMQFTDGQPPTIKFTDDSKPLVGVGGKLGAEMDISATQVPQQMSRLDAIAKSLVTTVNSIHNGATAYSGTPAVATTAGNFFSVGTGATTDPAFTARGMKLDAGLTSDKVAASAASAGPGNADVATALSNLRDQTLTITDSSGNTVGTNSIGGFFNETVGNLATATKYAQDDATVQSTLASNSQARRTAVSGVSTDEELVSVIQHQHSYQAAARLVSVVDEMTQTLVNLGQ